ncbi:MAG: response regulator [Trueperaceae bacterium]
MKRRTVLVAEPDAAHQQLIDVLLGAAFDLTLVADGSSALAHLRGHTPDALLLSTELPDVDGYTICRKAKSVGRLEQVKVVLVANAGARGGIDERTRGHARAAGGDLLLQRPLGDKNLRERLEQLFEAPAPDDGMTPPALFKSSVLEPGHQDFTVTGTSGMSFGGAPATELGALRAEAARLREENESLKSRLAKSKQLTKALEGQLEELRKKGRGGLFGRRG